MELFRPNSKNVFFSNFRKDLAKPEKKKYVFSKKKKLYLYYACCC